MASCSDMKVGDILECSECGLRLRVEETCKSCSAEDETCCTDCSFTCCDKELTVKSASAA